MRSLRSALVTLILTSAAILLLTGIGTAQTAASAAAKEFRRLVSLQTGLSKIPMEKQNKEPHRSFLRRNRRDIVYSDPAGAWYVRSNRFWDLEKKYRRLPIADKIAWTAAENPLPGECEGYVPCYLSSIRMTHGEYLRRYPKGAYSKRAVEQTVFSLSFMADDVASSQRNYEGPSESFERSEFVKAIQELREILSRVSHPETAKALSRLKLIEDGFK